jgi:hypothetical protein
MDSRIITIILLLWANLSKVYRNKLCGKSGISKNYMITRKTTKIIGKIKA